MNIIIFPQIDNKVAVMTPSGVLSIEDTAKKDVPTGVPYLILDSTELPTATPQEEWVFDFSNPDGHGE